MTPRIPPPPQRPDRPGVGVTDILAVVEMVDGITVEAITALVAKHRRGSRQSIENRVIRAVLVLAATGKVDLGPGAARGVKTVTVTATGTP